MMGMYNLQALKEGTSKMPDAGDGDQETGISLSRVLPEAFGGATGRYKELD